MRDGCDAAFLALHGAMVAEHTDDGEGELLRRVRAVAPRLPIAVGLDVRPYYSSGERAQRLIGWIEHYNSARPHGSLSDQPPMSRLARGNNLMLVHS